MIFQQKWFGSLIENGKPGEFFPAEVPGNIQYDYGVKNNFGDVNYSDNCEKFRPLENNPWLYRTELNFSRKDGERVFFVSHGIEYEYDIILNSKKLLHHEGMFTKIELDITDELENKNILEVYIYPHPKRKGADECRDQADQCCKPAVEYGWDWHPRLLVSGMWDEAYIETRDSGYINHCEALYTLSEDLKSAELSFDIDCGEAVTIELSDMEGNIIYCGNDTLINIDNVKLWWCNGQGNPYLYSWRAFSGSCEKNGRIGFKKVRLVMNKDQWVYPDDFPKSRSNPPITIELNGREIFAKGSNWVNPEIFNGRINEDTYRRLITLAREAGMNILRCWGGAIINKEAFFDFCDESGIMVWQEFPLACNNYVGTPHYLNILEQEASAIIKRLRSRACLVMWCGGNELFNNWSRMTDQSYALRLLDKLCYELDMKTPFIMTSPLSGMAHGHYVFYDYRTGLTPFEIFRNSSYTAYTEFGVPGITPFSELKKIIPPEIIQKPAPKTAWEMHHGFGAWDSAGSDAWLCLAVVDKFFGKQKSMEEYIEKNAWLQCEGLKCIFEEARRQKPVCSMAINWCFNEPWITAAGQSLITYPDIPKKAYYAVKDSLRPVMPSARIEHFNYTCSELFTAELWMLNDSPEEIEDTVEVYIEIGGNTEHILTWKTGKLPANENKRGHKIQFMLPESSAGKVSLILKSAHGDSRYDLLVTEKTVIKVNKHALNM